MGELSLGREGQVRPHSRIRCGGLLAWSLVGAAGGRGPEMPRLTPLQREFQTLPADLTPLFVLGDVNEDGRIDPRDQALVARFVGSGLADRRSIACLAAGDLTLDGKLDESDVTALGEWVSRGDSIVTFPLYGQPYLECHHGNRLVAAPLEWVSGKPVTVRLLKGQTTERVELTLDGPGESQARDDGSGWDIILGDDLSPDRLITLKVSLGGAPFAYTLANFSRLDGDAKAGAVAAAWVDAGRTDLDGDGRDDNPFGYPLPTAWGEEIAVVGSCPQKGSGCEALVIDFMKRTVNADADLTKAALEGVGCNLSYVAPSFVTIPKPAVYYGCRSIHGGVERIDYTPSPAEIDGAKASNRAAWEEIRAAIARHRANVSAGRDLVIQLVNGHGTGGGGYGNWGPGFRAGAGELSRIDFHRGNYLVTRGKACNAVAMDWSCYGGNTPKAIDRLNNTASVASPETPPGINHGFHAAFWGDMARSLSSASATCNNGNALVEDIELSGMIRATGRGRDYDRLASLGFRPRVLAASEGKYSDRGSNRRFGTLCENASHETDY